MPSDKTIKSLWNVVRKNLKVESDKEQDEDVRTVLLGLGASSNQELSGQQ